MSGHSDREGDAPIVLSQKDVRQLQCAKGAIATGIGVLKKEMGVKAVDLDEVLLAGAFGTPISTLSFLSALRFPPLDRSG